MGTKRVPVYFEILHQNREVHSPKEKVDEKNGYFVEEFEQYFLSAGSTV
jgi:hypothetical protein